MATATRQDIRTLAKLYADMRGTASGAVFADSDWNLLINRAARRYYDLLVESRGHEYFLTTTTTGLTGGSVVAGTATYTLPTDHYEFGTLTLEWSSQDHEPVHPIDSLKDLPRFANAGVWDRFGPKGLRIHGTAAGVQSLTLYPTPTTSVTARLRYTPAFADFSADTGPGGTIEVVNGWDDMIAVDAAYNARGICKLPTVDVEKRLARELERVTNLASERTANDPKRVIDVNPEGAFSPWPSRRVSANML